MPVLTPSGPTALSSLRTALSASTLSLLGSGVVFRENFLAPYAALALRLGDFSLPSHPFFASTYAYLTPSTHPDQPPTLTLQIELRPYDQDPANTLGIPVEHFSIHPTTGEPTHIRGDLISPVALFAALKCETWAEVSAFVQFGCLWRRREGGLGFEEHVVPITEALMGGGLRGLCGREAFVEMVRGAVDGNFLEGGVRVKEEGRIQAIEADGEGRKVEGDGGSEESGSDVKMWSRVR